MASTTFDFPQPLGPTMHVIPLPLNAMLVFSQNDLNPNISTFRSLSTPVLTRAAFAPSFVAAIRQYSETDCGGIYRQKRARSNGPCRLALEMAVYQRKDHGTVPQ